MIQHFHLWVDTWKKSKEEFERICTPIFREILFTAAARKPTGPSMDESRIQSIHTMGILFRLREGMLTPVLTWTLTLCWVKEARHRRTNTIDCVVIGFTEMRTKVVAPRAWGWGVPVEEQGSSCLVGTDFQFGKVLEMDDGDGHSTRSTYLRPVNYSLKKGA